MIPLSYDRQAYAGPNHWAYLKYPAQRLHLSEKQGQSAQWPPPFIGRRNHEGSGPIRRPRCGLRPLAIVGLQARDQLRLNRLSSSTWWV